MITNIPSFNTDTNNTNNTNSNDNTFDLINSFLKPSKLETENQTNHAGLLKDYLETAKPLSMEHFYMQNNYNLPQQQQSNIQQSQQPQQKSNVENDKVLYKEFLESDENFLSIEKTIDDLVKKQSENFQQFAERKKNPIAHESNKKILELEETVKEMKSEMSNLVALLTEQLQKNKTEEDSNINLDNTETTNEKEVVETEKKENRFNKYKKEKR